MMVSLLAARKAFVEIVAGLAMAVSYGFMITFLVLYGKALPEHAFFMLLFVPAFVMIASFVVAAGLKITNALLRSRGEEYTQIDRPLNKTYLAFPVPQLIGFLLMINYVLTGFGSPHVLGILQAILTQGSIPFTILLSRLLLKRKYNWMQILGGAIVIAGALISLKDDLVPSHSSDANSTSSGLDTASSSNAAYTLDALSESSITNQTTICDIKVHDSSAARIIWDFLYSLSTLPIALVNIIMEYFLQHSKGNKAERSRVGELNFPVATAANNIMLFIWLLAVFWLSLIPGVVPSCNGAHQSISEFGNNLQVSAQCIFLGHGGYTNASGLHKADFCNYGLLILTLLSTSTTVQIFLQAVAVRQHSATFTMALVTLGPIFAVFFQQSKVIMMNDYFYTVVNSQITGYTWVGLAVVMAGIIIFKIPSMLRAVGRCPSLHPQESDPTQSFIYKVLAKRLLRHLPLVQQGSDEDATTTNPGDIEPLLVNIEINGLHSID